MCGCKDIATIGRAFEDARRIFQGIEQQMRRLEDESVERFPCDDEELDTARSIFLMESGYHDLRQQRHEAATRLLEAGRDYIARITPKFYDVVRPNLDAAIGGKNRFSRSRALVLLCEIKVDEGETGNEEIAGG